MIVIPNILQAFLQSIPMSFPVLTHSDDGTNTTIEIENIYYLRPGMSVNIDGSLFTVVSVDYDTNEFVISGVIADPLVAEIPALYFWHGTPMMTNNSWGKVKKNLGPNNVFPCLYLYEIVREDFGTFEDPVINTTLRLFFLDQINKRDYEQWSTDTHYSNVIIPMRNFIERFIDYVNNQSQGRKYFATNASVVLINHANFGKFTDNKGHTSSIFSEFTSGVEMTLNVNIFKTLCN